ncbi:RBBP9/YdeN family alpha/beta hydrolase [Luteimicrobium sp. NPDC057192]|uniref:RBBP9/YdeN family alpha/beta hydrolase n=1 Tax=Luteimicrobium sp. NPDC057192 TaxID=3346042 RepID=UPI0036342A2D
MTRGFLVLHGWGNHRPPEHWQHWLAGELAERGHVVRYPQLPDTDEPRLEAWLDALTAELATLDPASTTVVCHSLAVPLWLRAVTDGLVPTVERVLLVSPPSSAVLASTVVAPFVASPPTTTGARSALVVTGEGDPFSPEGPWDEYATPLGADVVTVAGGGHLTPSDGFGPEWPDLLDRYLTVPAAAVSEDAASR